ncbi:hypothetical protein ACJLW8_004901 [Raoultella ornithinolytica]|uniref:hypothetical protein n=1 Tax=Raoultella ornithinolytica TaxID=54291 RepID=UPI001A30D838|nr:hypothetical protein [Raoultella ornithinolytica]MEB7992218.1 hypothetical protein [Raoultella ornithinolytica]HAT1558684.1 hypothetical protein [Raoultella ornithinolytica]
MIKFKIKIDELAWFTFHIFIFVKAFTGPLTLYLAYIRFAPIALMLVLVGYKLCILIPKKLSYILLMIFLSIYVLIGMNNNSLISSVFGIYIFIPFLFAFLYSTELYQRIFTNNFKFNLFYFLSCAIGIFYVNQFGAEWIGAEQEIAGVTKVVSRDWISNGMMRNPGFTGTSVSSATLIIITCTFLGYTFLEKRRFISLLGIFVLSAYLIYLTTTKTTMVTLGFVFILIFCSSFLTKYIVKIIFLLLTLFSYYCMFNISNVSTGMLTNTMLIRMYQTWPNAMLLLETPMQYFFGKGFGSIGVPTYYFTPALANSADNMYVYLYVIFGVFSVLFSFFFIMKFLSFGLSLSKSTKQFLIMSLVILTGGITSNLFEASFYSVYGGVIIGMIFSEKKERDLKLNSESQ